LAHQPHQGHSSDVSVNVFFIVSLRLDSIVCFKIESASDRVGTGEKEFIVSPAYGASAMQAITNKQTVEHKYWTTYKKPFDWMTDDQFVNLQVSPVAYGIPISPHPLLLFLFIQVFGHSLFVVLRCLRAHVKRWP
jgi:hypothetical protein